MENGVGTAKEEENEKALAKRRGPQLMTLYIVYCLYQSGLGLLTDAKMMVFLRAWNNDTARYIGMTARVFVICDGLCTVCSPFMGALSDWLGRRAVLIGGAGWNLFLRLQDFAICTPGILIFSMCTSPPIIGIQQMINTSIGDLFPGDAKGAGGALARLQIGQVVGSIIFPYVSGRLAAINVRLPLAIGSVLAGATLLGCLVSKETLPREKRQPKLDTSKISPLGSFKMFTYGRKLAILGFAQALYAMMDGFMLGRFNFLVNSATLGWSIVESGKFTSQQNAMNIPSLYLAGPIVKAIGAVPSLLLGAGAIAAQYFLSALWVGTSQTRLYYTLPLELFRGLNTAALATLYLQAGKEVGLNQAELMGCQQGMMMFVWAAGGLVWAGVWAKVLDLGKGVVPSQRKFYLGPGVVCLVMILLGLIGQALPKAEPRAKEGQEGAALRASNGQPGVKQATPAAAPIVWRPSGEPSSDHHLATIKRMGKRLALAAEAAKAAHQDRPRLLSKQARLLVHLPADED